MKSLLACFPKRKTVDLKNDETAYFPRHETRSFLKTQFPRTDAEKTSAGGCVFAGLSVAKKCGRAFANPRAKNGAHRAGTCGSGAACAWRFKNGRKHWPHSLHPTASRHGGLGVPRAPPLRAPSRRRFSPREGVEKWWARLSFRRVCGSVFFIYAGGELCVLQIAKRMKIYMTEMTKKEFAKMLQNRCRKMVLSVNRQKQWFSSGRRHGRHSAARCCGGAIWTAKSTWRSAAARDGAARAAG